MSEIYRPAVDGPAVPATPFEQDALRRQAVSHAYGPRPAPALKPSSGRDPEGRLPAFGQEARLAMAGQIALAGRSLFGGQADAAHGAPGQGAERPPARWQRQEDRQHRREQRRQKIRELLHGAVDTFKGLDAGKLSELAGKLPQALKLIEAARALAETVRGIEGTQMQATADGKLAVTIRRAGENRLQVNERKDNVTVRSVDVGRELSFRVALSDGAVRLEDIKGIKINATVELPRIPGTSIGGPRDVCVELRSAAVDKDRTGRTVLKAEVSNPLLPGHTMPVVIPISDRPPAPAR